MEISSEQTPEGLRLNNPAGHLDPGESLVQGAVREALEETARDFHPEALLGVYLSRFQRAAADGSVGQDITYLRFAFCGHGRRADPRPQPRPRNRPHALDDAWTKPVTAAAATEARCCCSAWRTMRPAGATRSRP
jgi:8-oxo-dGTP pyrophosphatase MutT (NUDIX family)